MKKFSLRLQSVFDFSESCKKFGCVRRWGWRSMRKVECEKSAGDLFTCGKSAGIKLEIENWSEKRRKFWK